MGDWLIALGKAIAFMATLDVLPRSAVPGSARVVLGLLLVPLLLQRHADRGSFWHALLEAILTAAICGLSISVLTAAARGAGATIDGLLGGGFLGRDLSSQGAAFELLYGYAFALVFVASGAFASCITLLLTLPDQITLTHHFVAMTASAFYRHALAIAGPAFGIQCAVSVALGIFGRLSPQINGMLLTTPLTSIMLLIVILTAAAAWWHQLVAVALTAVNAAPGR